MKVPKGVDVFAPTQLAVGESEETLIHKNVVSDYNIEERKKDRVSKGATILVQNNALLAFD